MIALASAFLVLAASGGGCGEEGGEQGEPHITLLHPEAGTHVREYLAVAGETSGAVERVDVSIDGDPNQTYVATREGDSWFVLIDAQAITDGSHVVTATAYGSGDQIETSPERQFVARAHEPDGSILIEGRVTDLSSGGAIAGATVGVLEGSESTLADSTGTYALTGLTPGLPVVLKATTSLPGYWAANSYRLAQGEDTDEVNLPLPTQLVIDYIAGEYGVVQSPAKGVTIGFLVSGGEPLEGATVSLNQGSDGPFYIGDGPDPFDETLTATSSAGQFVFFNVDAGPLDITAVAGTAQFFTVGSASRPQTLSLVAGFTF